jgi:hypothetical protein
VDVLDRLQDRVSRGVQRCDHCGGRAVWARLFLDSGIEAVCLDPSCCTGPRTPLQKRQSQLCRARENCGPTH